MDPIDEGLSLLGGSAVSDDAAIDEGLQLLSERSDATSTMGQPWLKKPRKQDGIAPSIAGAEPTTIGPPTWFGPAKRADLIVDDAPAQEEFGPDVMRVERNAQTGEAVRRQLRNGQWSELGTDGAWLTVNKIDYRDDLDPRARQGFVGAVTDWKAKDIPFIGAGLDLPRRAMQTPDEAAFEAFNEPPRTGLGKFGRVLKDMVPFATEFAAGAGVAGAAKGIAKGATDAAIGRAAATLPGRIAGRVAGGVGAASAQFGATQVPRAITNVAGRAATSDDESFAESLYKGVGDQYIETLSEYSGGALARPAGWLANKTGLTALKGVIAKRWLSQGKGRTMADFAAKVAETTGWNGAVGEVGEEFIGGAMRDIAGIEPFKGFTPEEIGVMAAAFSVPGAASAGLQAGESFIRGRIERAAGRKKVGTQGASDATNTQEPGPQVGGSPDQVGGMAGVANDGAAAPDLDPDLASVVGGEGAPAGNKPRNVAGVGRPWELTEEEQQRADELKSRAMRGEANRPEDQEFRDDLDRRFDLRARATPQEAAQMSHGDFQKWAGVRLNGTPDEAIDLAAAFMLRGEDVGLQAIKNRIADRLIAEIGDDAAPDEIARFKANQEEWQATFDAIEEAEKQYPKPATSPGGKGPSNANARPARAPAGPAPVANPQPNGQGGTAQPVAQAGVSGSQGVQGAPAAQGQRGPSAVPPTVGANPRTPDGVATPAVDRFAGMKRHELIAEYRKKNISDESGRRIAELSEDDLRSALRTADELTSGVGIEAQPTKQPQPRKEDSDESEGQEEEGQQEGLLNDDTTAKPEGASLTAPSGEAKPTLEHPPGKWSDGLLAFIALHKENAESVGESLYAEKKKDLAPSQSVNLDKDIKELREYFEGKRIIDRKPRVPTAKPRDDTTTTPSTTFKDGDRVAFTSNGKPVTGTVRGTPDSDGLVEVKVDQIKSVGGVPIGRIEYVPVRMLKAEGKEQTSPAPSTIAQVPDWATTGKTIYNHRGDEFTVIGQPSVTNRGQVRIRSKDGAAFDIPLRGQGSLDDNFYPDLELALATTDEDTVDAAFRREFGENPHPRSSKLDRIRAIVGNRGAKTADGKPPATKPDVNPKGDAIAPTGLDRRMREVRAAASAAGWELASKPDDQRIRLHRPDGRTLIAIRQSEGVWGIEVSRAVNYTPRGKNALNMEPTQAVEFKDSRPLEWDGKRQFEGAEVFRVLASYMEMNPANSVAEKPPAAKPPLGDLVIRPIFGGPDVVIPNKSPDAKPGASQVPDLTTSGQSKPVPGRPGLSYVVHARKPDMLPDTFRVIISRQSPFRSMDGKGMTAREAYDDALVNFDAKGGQTHLVDKPPAPANTPVEDLGKLEANYKRVLGTWPPAGMTKEQMIQAIERGPAVKPTNSGPVTDLTDQWLDIIDDAEGRAPYPPEKPKKPAAPQKPPAFQKPNPTPKPSTALNLSPEDQAKADALKKQLRDLLGGGSSVTINSGIDPVMAAKVVALGTQLGLIYAKNGMRRFNTWARKLVEDIGPAVKPYLRSIWGGVRGDPEAREFRKEMESADTIADLTDAELEARLDDSGASEPEPRGDEAATDSPQRSDPVDHIFKMLGDAYDRYDQPDGYAATGTKPFDTIIDARKAIAEVTGQPVEAGTPAAKRADEIVEQAIVRMARRIVEVSRRSGTSAKETLKRLTDLYNLQPNLGVRTSTSISQQAYSTPAPLAFITSHLAGVSNDTHVYEPTAGNGMLLIEATPTNSTVNELNKDRAESLRQQGFKTTEHDAATWAPPAKSVDRIVANPPFGKVTNDAGVEQRFKTEFYTTKDVDHAITIKALSALKDGGRAVIILGGKKGTDAERKTAYRNPDVAPFWHFLFKNYNVTDHFTVSGDLYAKQGAKFPVDVVVIEGRGGNTRALPGVELPRVYDSWNALAEVLNKDRIGPSVAPQLPTGGVGSSGVSGLDTGRPDRAGAADADKERVSGPSRVPPSMDGRSESEGGAATDSGGTGSDVRSGSGRGGTGGGRSDSRRNAGDGPAVVPPEGSANTQPFGDRGDAAGDADGLAGRADAARPDVKASDLQVAYTPSARKATAIGTLAPKNLAQSMSAALERAIEQEGAPAETIVARELKIAPEKVIEYFSAEQVDALVLGIVNAKAGKGFIIGDQTGVGKGRWVAGMLRWAELHGMIPVFVSEKPNLYADIVRDATDIGMKGYELLPTNSNLTGKDVLPLEDGREIRSLSNIEDRLEEAVANFKAGRGLVATKGRKPTKFNAIATTYSQLQTVKGGETRRRGIMRDLAPVAMFVFDESHNAGGQTKSDFYKDEDAPESRSELIRSLVGAARATMYSSATYAKRPDVMDLYRATDMRLAVDKIENLGEAIRAGGIPMQQMVAEMLSRAGQYVRRERSFDGVTVDSEIVKADMATADKISEVFAAIDAFDRLKQGGLDDLKDDLAGQGASLGDDTSTGKGGVTSVNFASLMHNVVSQMLLSMKVDASVARIKKSLESGEKAVISLDNTMETVLERAMGVAPIGSPSNATFNNILSRYLERSREVLVKPPGAKKGEAYQHYMTDAELGPAALAKFNEARAMIERLDARNIPVSPIDRLIHLLSQIEIEDPFTGKVRKVRVGEITGRKIRLDYSTAVPTYQSRPDSERSAAGRIRAVAEYQAGSIDVMIVNPAGATGISMHTDKKRAKDLRRRRMFVLQPNPNIDTQMQMFGRVHRTGQVTPPAYTLIMSDLPAEKRPAAVLMKKLASLNANVSADRKGAMSFDVPDVMNSIGDQVILEILSADPDLMRAIDFEVDPGEERDEEVEPGKIVQKVTGKLALLPMERQQAVWDQLDTEMRATLDRLTRMGTNPLEAARVDLRAKTISKEILKQPPAASASPFTEPAFIETVQTRVESKAPNAKRLWAMVAETAGEMGREKDRWRAQTIDETRAAFEEYWTEKSRELSDGQRAYREEQNKLLERLTFSAIHDLSPGMPVRFESGVLGVVTDLRRKPGMNPIAPSSWMAHIAVADHYGHIEVPLSQYGGARSVMVSAVTTHLDTISEAFDKASQGGTQERVIVTGNMLAGYEAVNKRGSVVFYTTEDGSLRPGILMPADFGVADALSDMPLQFTTAEKARTYLSGGEGRKVVSQDAVLHVERVDAQTFAFEAPKSKKVGGEYTLQKAALAAAGTEYVSAGARMTMEVPAGRLAAVLSAYMQTGTKFRIPTTNVKGERERDQKIYGQIEGTSGSGESTERRARSIASAPDVNPDAVVDPEQGADRPIPDGAAAPLSSRPPGIVDRSSQGDGAPGNDRSSIPRADVDRIRREFEGHGPGHVKMSRGFDDMVRQGTMSDGSATALRAAFMDADDGYMGKIDFAELPARLARKQVAGFARFPKRGQNGRPVEMGLYRGLEKHLRKQGMLNNQIDLHPVAVFIEEWMHIAAELVTNGAQKQLLEREYQSRTAAEWAKHFEAAGLNQAGAEYAAISYDEWVAHQGVLHVLGTAATPRVRPIFERVLAAFKKALRSLAKHLGYIPTDLRPIFEAMRMGRVAPEQGESEGSQTDSPNPANPDIRPSRVIEQSNQDELGFFSRLERWVGDKMRGPMHPDQLRKAIANAGLPADEIKWTGIDAWLADQKQPVKPDAVKKWLSENRVVLKEVVKGGTTKDRRLADAVGRRDAAHQKADRIMSRFDGRDAAMSNLVDAARFYNSGGPSALTNEEAFYKAVQPYSEDIQSKMRKAGLFDAFVELRAAWKEADAAQAASPRDNQTRFAQYTLPGGDNYREVLLTLPGKQYPPLTEAEDEERRALNAKVYDAGEAAKPEDRERMKELNARHYNEGFDRGRSPFTSSHFSEPNIIAHLRIKDRTTPDGRRVLFLEEVQSDWHEAGRDRGYKDPAKVKALQDERARLDDQAGDIGRKQNALWEAARVKDPKLAFGGPQIIDEGEAANTFRALDADRRALTRKREAIDREISGLTGAPPPAPWSKNWHEMALRRAIRMAAQGGYDAIGWTTGATQIDRYDTLTRNVRDIRYDPKDGTLEARTFANDQWVEHGRDVKPSDIAAWIGKDAARELLASKPDGDGRQSVSGTGMSIGGQGMRTFYDRDLPNYAKKYGKRWGVEPEMGKVWADAGAPETASTGDAEYDNVELAQLAGETFDQPVGGSAGFKNAHILPINEEMRESVMEDGVEQFGRSLFGNSRPAFGLTPTEMIRSIAGQMQGLAKQVASADVTHNIIATLAGIDLGGRAKDARDRVAGMFGDWAGKTLPRTTRADRLTGEAGARYIAAQAAAVPLGNAYADSILAAADQRLTDLAGGVLTEDNLRDVKKQLEDQAAAETDPDKASALSQQAADVFTLVGNHDGALFDDEAAYRDAMTDPKVQNIIARYQIEFGQVMDDLYKQAAGIDPGEVLPTRGLELGVRINLKARKPDDADPDKPAAARPAGPDRLRPFVKKSPFAQKATGAASLGYDYDLRNIMVNTVVKQTEIAAQREWYKAAVNGKVAAVGTRGKGLSIDGKPGHEIPIRYRTLLLKTGDGAKAVPQNHSLYVRSDLAEEFENALTLNRFGGKTPGRKSLVMGAKVLNGLALYGWADAITHGGNIVTAVLTRPGVGKGEIGRRLADFGGAIGVASAMTHLFMRSVDVLTGKPHATSRMADLTTMAAAKGKFTEAQGLFGKIADNVFNGKFIIETLDDAARLVMDDAFTALADKGLVKNTETNRREFINQLGQYHKRAQWAVRRALRESEVGPFVTAGTTFRNLGFRNISLSPGAEATTKAAAARLRVAVLSRWLGTIGSIALLNIMLAGGDDDRPLWEKAKGRDGVPLGAIDLGSSDERGRPKYLDTLEWMGYRRALRVTGIDETIKGAVYGLPPGVVFDNAARQALTHSFVNPASGPLPRFAAMAAKGTDPGGLITGQRRAPVVQPGESQTLSDFKAALRESNQLSKLVYGPISDVPNDYDVADVLKQLFPRYATREGRNEPPEKTAKKIMGAKLNEFIDDLGRRARSLPQSKRGAFIRAEVADLEPAERVRAIKELFVRKKIMMSK